MTVSDPLSPEEKANVQRCLDLLEEAQSLVNAAAAALCSVRGFADEWDRLHEPYKVIKRHWYAIDGRRSAILYPTKNEQGSAAADKPRAPRK